MTVLQADSALMRVLGWAVLHSLWQGALIAAVFTGLQNALRRRSPHLRYVAACVALSLLFVLPLATVSLTPGSSGNAQDFPAVTLRGAQGELVQFDHAGSPGSLTLLRRTSALLDRSTPFVSAGWFAGVIFFSLRLTGGFWSLRRLRRTGNQAVDTGWLEALNDLRCRFEIWRPVRLMNSALVQVPTVIGWIRPLILVPVSMASGLAPEQLEALLAHELAHIRRFDYVVNLFQCVIETLMFYHPAVWWISRIIREEREHCCDELVVRICGDRLGYARALSVLEELRVETPQLAFAASGGSLLGRIRRLLGAPDDAGPIRSRQIAGLLVLLFGIVLAAAGLQLWLSKPEYRATTRVRIERSYGGVDSARYDPWFIQTEFEVIGSRAVLADAIERCKAAESEFGQRDGVALSLDEKVEALRSRLWLRPIRNTAVMEISISGHKPQPTVEMVNAVAQACRDFHQNLARRRADVAINTLKDRIADQEKHVQAQQKVVDDLQEKLAIPDLMGSPSFSLAADNVRKLEGQRLELTTKLAHDTSVWEELTKLDRERLEIVLPTTFPDDLLTSLLEQRSLNQQALIQKKHDYGDAHPDIVRSKAVIEDLDHKISERVEGIMIAVEQRVRAGKKALDALETRVEEWKKEDIDLAEKARPYFEAKRKLDELQRFSLALNMKVASETIDSALPRTSQLEILDPATVAAPVHPGRIRAVTLVGAGLFLALAGLFLARS
jgi:uncharacterized protein involved in exopolysaccharide biosynthesis